MRRDVEFTSGSETVRGWLYLPEGEGPHPVVVMAGGWCYVKELVQPHYAEHFVDAGMAALIFDYRRLGSSDGEPRQHIDPNAQIEDYRNAISFVAAQPELDAERVAIWGISYSGGHVLIVGATDRRVKAIVSNIPVVDGWENMRRVHGTVGFRKLREAIETDRVRRFETGEHGYMDMSTSKVGEVLCTWPFPETYEAFNQLKATEAPAHEHRNTIASTELLLSYTVFPYLARILDVPTLMVVADDDDLTLWDKEIEAYNQIATAEKELFIVPKIKHMTLYSERAALEIPAAKAAAWLAERLVAAPEPVAA
jgi:cephalosporin-C deacetylase-like acetyl esterase